MVQFGFGYFQQDCTISEEETVPLIVSTADLQSLLLAENVDLGIFCVFSKVMIYRKFYSTEFYNFDLKIKSNRVDLGLKSFTRLGLGTCVKF